MPAESPLTRRSCAAPFGFPLGSHPGDNVDTLIGRSGTLQVHGRRAGASIATMQTPHSLEDGRWSDTTRVAGSSR
jgi:hypothetical protein